MLRRGRGAAVQLELRSRCGSTKAAAAQRRSNKVSGQASREDVASAGPLARLAQAEVRGEAALLGATPEGTAAGWVYGRATGQRLMV